MHTLGIVHRDLKLDNVIFTGNENEIDIKLIDFGLAKRIEIETKRKHTKVGSFYFMGINYHIFFILFFSLFFYLL